MLTYHSVGTSSPALPVDNFREQMRWLKENAAVVPLDGLIEGNWPESPFGLVCAITFDDGYASVYRHALPVLAEYALPATVYLVAGAIRDDTPQSSNMFSGLYPNEDMLIWPEVRELISNAVQMGSHLVSHRDITSLAPQEVDEELRRSKAIIEEKTGTECGSFCFPWGRHNEPTLVAVRDAGYRNSVITIQGRWQKHEPPDPYRIPRADVRREYSLSDFQAVVRGDWDYLGRIQALRRLWN